MRSMSALRRMPPPLGIARLGGAMNLIVILLGLFEELFVRQRLIVAHDALATATNLQAHELLWRAGIVAERSS